MSKQAKGKFIVDGVRYIDYKNADGSFLTGASCVIGRATDYESLEVDQLDRHKHLVMGEFETAKEAMEFARQSFAPEEIHCVSDFSRHYATEMYSAPNENKHREIECIIYGTILTKEEADKIGAYYDDECPGEVQLRDYGNNDFKILVGIASYGNGIASFSPIEDEGFTSEQRDEARKLAMSVVEDAKAVYGSTVNMGFTGLKKDNVPTAGDGKGESVQEAQEASVENMVSVESVQVNGSEVTGKNV